MKAAEIEKIVQDINQKYLGGLFDLIVRGEDNWELAYDDDYSLARGFWLNNPRNFEIRHGGGREIMHWIDFHIRNEVALYYDGNISDDGCPGAEKGTPGKYPTFKDWCKMYSHWQLSYKVGIEKLPDELKFVIMT